MLGGAGDILRGSSGNDRVDGGPGNDVLTGDTGFNTLIGGDGDDIVLSAYRLDRVSAGAGNDFVIRSGMPGVTLDCGAGTDTVISRDPARIAQLRRVGGRARNRGRRAGGDTPAADAGVPAATGAGFDSINGSGLSDTITTRPPIEGRQIIGITPTAEDARHRRLRLRTRQRDHRLT